MAGLEADPAADQEAGQEEVADPAVVVEVEVVEVEVAGNPDHQEADQDPDHQEAGQEAGQEVADPADQEAGRGVGQEADPAAVGLEVEGVPAVEYRQTDNSVHRSLPSPNRNQGKLETKDQPARPPKVKRAPYP